MFHTTSLIPRMHEERGYQGRHGDWPESVHDYAYMAEQASRRQRRLRKFWR